MICPRFCRKFKYSRVVAQLYERRRGDTRIFFWGKDWENKKISKFRRGRNMRKILDFSPQFYIVFQSSKIKFKLYSQRLWCKCERCRKAVKRSSKWSLRQSSSIMFPPQNARLKQNHINIYFYYGVHTCTSAHGMGNAYHGFAAEARGVRNWIQKRKKFQVEYLKKDKNF